MRPRVSIVIPVYNEGDAITACLDRIFEAVLLPCEVLVVYDTEDDTTLPPLREYQRREPRLRPLLNTFGRGPAHAIHYGITHAQAAVAVVTMADGSDDPMQIDQLTRLVDRGIVVASASRYAHGGQQVGGPRLKGFMSRMAGLSLYHLARVGTRDATNSFKAYSTSFVEEVGIESTHGFEIGIELVAKARRYRQPVADIPTVWVDRTIGKSNFKLWAWIPKYLHWYLYAFGSRRHRATSPERAALIPTNEEVSP